MSRIPEHGDPLPSVDTDQMIEVDRAMIADFHIELIQMMENAGRNLAHLARERFLGGDPRGKRVVVLAGTGGNGGGAMVAARRLANWGAAVSVYTTRPGDAYGGVAGHQLDILQRMGASLEYAAAPPAGVAADAVLDGVIGYSLAGAPRGVAAELIRWANQQPSPVVSLDVPSGLDTTAGTAFEPAIRAAATLTLALPKTGLFGGPGAELVGELYAADISVPPELYAASELGLRVGRIFALGDVVRLRRRDAAG